MPRNSSWIRKVAGAIAGSRLMAQGHRLWDANQADQNLHMTKLDKLQCGTHLILSDFAAGKFPPTFEDQQKTYDAEIAYTPVHGAPEKIRVKHYMSKPFWTPQSTRYYLSHYIETVDAFARCGIRPPNRVLELGCGTGWMTEWLATQGYDIVGTTLSPREVELARTRLAGLASRGVDVRLRFEASPMESADEAVRELLPFDAVFVYEALHHAYDWKRTFESAFRCLRPGGWFFVLHEPNVLHTLVSYRVARLTNTHEIGFSRPAVIRHLRITGFDRVIILKNRLNLLATPLWLAAQRPER